MKALIISDCEKLRKQLRKDAESFNLEITEADNLADALEEVNKGEHEIILSDVLRPGSPKLLQAALKANSEVRFTTVTGKMNVWWLIKTLAQGAFDYIDLQAPFNVRDVIRKAIGSAIDDLNSGGTSDEQADRRAYR